MFENPYLPHSESTETVSPQDEVINLLDGLIETHAKESKFEDAETQRKRFASTDKAVTAAASEYEKTLTKILERYGCRARVEKVGNGLFRIPVTYPYLKKLPAGYGYMGGAARATLVRTLGIDQSATPRDIDIVRVTNQQIPELDTDLAEKYSAEDYSHGHGVQELPADYFATRDFTINEVLLYGNWIYTTKNCLLDTVRRVLRLTDYELTGEDENGETGVSGKLLAKAARLAAEELAQGKQLELRNQQHYQFANINPFYMALHLDRAFQRGARVALEYVRQLVRLKQLPDSITGTREAADYLLERVRQPFVFQYAPDSVLETDEGMDEMYQRFGHLIEKYEDPESSHRKRA